jgi:predicted transcriptional regulator YheO
MDSNALLMAMSAIANPKSIASEVAKRLNITTATLYSYVNADGSLKPRGTHFLNPV